MAKNKLKNQYDFDVIKAHFDHFIEVQRALNELYVFSQPGRCVLDFHGFGIGVPVEDVKSELILRREKAVSRMAEWGIEVEFTE